MLKNAPMLTYDKKSKQPRGLGRGAYRGMGMGLVREIQLYYFYMN